MLNVVMSLLIWGTSAVVLLSILYMGGVPLPASVTGKFTFLDKSKKFEANETNSWKTYLEIFVSSFLFRVVLIFAAVVAICLFMQDTALTFEGFLDKLVIWDGQWYMSIAKGGYDEYIQDGQPITLCFFPMYSILVRVVASVVGNLKVAGLLVSALCYSAGNCFLFAFVCKSYGKEIATKAVKYLAISPWGFFFGTLMSESLFFLMISMCLYFIHENKWWQFAIAGVFCSLTRMQGVLIIIPACIQWFETYKPVEKIRQKDWKAFWQSIYSKLIFLPIPVLGIVIYLIINWKVAGDPFAFLEYQKTNWTHSYQYIGQALKLDFDNALLGELTLQRVSIWIPQMLFFLLALGLGIYGAKKHDNKLVAHLLAYAVVSYSLDWLISGSRYLLTAVPMWIILGELGNRYKRLDRAISTLSPIFMGVYFVGYLFWKHIC